MSDSELQLPEKVLEWRTLVPDRAMVPRLFTRSAFVMPANQYLFKHRGQAIEAVRGMQQKLLDLPTPLSVIVSVLFALSGVMWM